MKKDKHPPYQEVLFVDSSTGHKFLIGSTLQPEKQETFEGKSYPVHHVSVSSASHPFFTGSKQFIDSEGRVDKFLKKYASASKKQQEEKQQEEKQQEEKQQEGKPSAKKKAPVKRGKKKAT